MTYHKQENPHKAINRFMSLIPCRQGGDEILYSKYRKKKKCQQRILYLTKLKIKGRENLSQTKAEGVYHHLKCLTRNAKESSSTSNEKTLNNILHKKV